MSTFKQNKKERDVLMRNLGTIGMKGKNDDAQNQINEDGLLARAVYESQLQTQQTKVQLSKNNNKTQIVTDEEYAMALHEKELKRTLLLKNKRKSKKHMKNKNINKDRATIITTESYATILNNLQRANMISIKKSKSKNSAKNTKEPSFTDRMYSSVDVFDEMKDQVDNGETDFEKATNRLEICFDNDISQNKTQYKRHFKNYCNTQSPQNVAKNKKKRNKSKPNNWCNYTEKNKKSQYKNRSAARSLPEIKYKNKFKIKLKHMTPDLLRQQSSADLGQKSKKDKIKEKVTEKLKWFQQKLTPAKTQKNNNNEQKNNSDKNNENNGSNDHYLNSPHNILLIEQQSFTPQEQIFETLESKMTEEFGFCYDTMNINQLRQHCEPFQRVAMVLEAYQELLTTKNEAKLFDIVHQKGKYEHQQLHDDFMHIKIYHIDVDNQRNQKHLEHTYEQSEEKYLDIGKKICKYFAVNLRLKCNGVANCRAFSRHYQRFVDTTDADWCTEDIAFRTECDKIHIFFLHSTVKFGIKYNRISVEHEKEIDEQNRYLKGRIFSKRYVNTFSDSEDSNIPQQNKMKNVKKLKQSKKYIGKKEDDKWWNHINPNDEKQDEEQIYRALIQKMGVFRWQNPRGFESGKNQQVSHYKPKFKNIKEEALKNEYEQLSKDNWNQTLRKSKIFFNSWARQRISTKYKGYFIDQVSGDQEHWDKGEIVKLEDIVTLKMYTDFDKLQFALKKCFRFESYDRILQQAVDMTDDQIISKKEKYEQNKADLKNRLENFYHWRAQLLIVLNKFGTKLNSNMGMILYHGVNSKMVILPTQTYGFNGPLSTTSSYHVARTFSTAKGMVLKITSHFPRLNYCNAFDASLISDYPEEQEWLVGFMYARLLMVRTRRFVDNVASFHDLLDKMNLSSWAKEIFFAIHLFKAQIFSMSEHLERILAQFLKVNRKECCDEKVQEYYKEQHEQFNDWNVDCMCSSLCKYAKHSKGNEAMQISNQSNDDDVNRQMKIDPLMWSKFNDFRFKPNRRQCVKFDEISGHLKRFFMEQIDFENIDTGDKKWIISFDQINKVYPNIKEIHFINQYRFDDKILDNLIEYIKDKNNTIEKIVFLYYNYKSTNEHDEQNKPLNDKIFKDPDTLNENSKHQLEENGWKIKHGKNGASGYKIRIYAK